MKPHQQPLKSIPNIRSQYYVAAATLSVSAKINKAKSTLIDDKCTPFLTPISSQRPLVLLVHERKTHCQQPKEGQREP